MTLIEQFEKAAIESTRLPAKPANTTLLNLYSLYKQSTLGDNDNAAPSDPFDFVKKAKHTAWLEQKGKPKEEAMQEYIQIVKSLME